MREKRKADLKFSFLFSEELEKGGKKRGQERKIRISPCHYATNESMLLCESHLLCFQVSKVLMIWRS